MFLLFLYYSKHKQSNVQFTNTTQIDKSQAFILLGVTLHRSITNK